MASTDNSTPTYITPLRRSLGLSRRLKGNTHSPVTPSTTTPFRASHNYISPSIIRKNNENLNTTPVSTTHLKDLMSPLKTESTNRTESAKRLWRLSLNKSKSKEQPQVKKKRLEFLENGCQNDDEIENSNPVLKIDTNENDDSTTNNKEQDDYISSSQMVSLEILTQIPNTELELNDELANELKEIEFLKQKQYRRRINYGFKVREDKLKNMDEFNGSIQLQDTCKTFELSQFAGFQFARDVLKATKNSDSTTKQKSHEEHIEEIKGLIKIWRRGLRDAVEYLSCLTYPPTDIQTILRHHDISPELLISM